jgi:hypothetical protein
MAVLRTFRALFGCSILLLGACSTSLHGSFVTMSYAGAADVQDAEEIGPVRGRSCQTQPLYVFASRDQATTDEAIKEAKSFHTGTRFIADISIDDETQ